MADFLVVTGSDKLFLKLKHFFLFTKQASLARRATVGVPALGVKILGITV